MLMHQWLGRDPRGGTALDRAAVAEDGQSATACCDERQARLAVVHRGQGVRVPGVQRDRVHSFTLAKPTSMYCPPVV